MFKQLFVKLIKINKIKLQNTCCLLWYCRLDLNYFTVCNGNRCRSNQTDWRWTLSTIDFVQNGHWFLQISGRRYKGRLHIYWLLFKSCNTLQIKKCILLVCKTITKGKKWLFIFRDNIVKYNLGMIKQQQKYTTFFLLVEFYYIILKFNNFVCY